MMRERKIDDNKLLEILSAISDFDTVLEKALKKKETFTLRLPYRSCFYDCICYLFRFTR